MRITVGRAVAACACMAMLASAGAALGSANNKKHGYDSQGESSAGVAVALPDGTVVAEIGRSRTDGDVHKAESGHSSSTASGHSLSVLGQGIGGTADCEAQGTDNAGVDQEGGAAAVADETSPDGAFRIRVLWAECEATAVQANNAHPTASSGVLRLEGDVNGEQHSLAVLEGGSSADPTSGQSRSAASFSVVEADGTVLLGCTASSEASRGASADGEQLVVAGTAQPIDDCPVVESTATHTRG